MRRALVLGLAVCLLAPAGATAKGGVIFDRYPDVQALGSPMKFTAMLFNREGVRPLVTFRNSTTGEVVRVRASRSDLNGISYGSVALPSMGPWSTEITVHSRAVMPGDSEPFRVGVGLTQTIPSADAERAATVAVDRASSDGAPAWIRIALVAAASAALAVALHRRRRWGAA